MEGELNKEPEERRAELDRAMRHSVAGLAAHSQMLLQAALNAGGAELVAEVEEHLRAGASPLVRVALLPGGVEVAVAVAGAPDGRAPLEVFSASGTLPTREGAASH